MRAYSTDLRERIVRVVAEGRPMREAARRFGVSVSAVKRYVVRQQETGSLERKPIPGGPRKISRAQDAILLARLEAEPDATVLEHCTWWAQHQGQQVSEATMWRALHRLGWTHKKSHWQPANATKKRGSPGGKPSPSATRRSSSLSTKAVRTSPSRGATAGHRMTNAPRERCRATMGRIPPWWQPSRPTACTSPG